MNPQPFDPTNTPRAPQLTLSNKTKLILPLLALAVSAFLYGLHFFVGGGYERLLSDSEAYLYIAQGGHIGAPYNVRFFGPFAASLIARVSGISAVGAFHILTPLVLIASLILLGRLISRRGGSVEFQAAVLLALGCALAATFGYIPVMVDPLLLVLTCLTLVALESDYLIAAIACATLAALTKEYGLFLAFIVFLVAYRNGRRKLALIGILLPAGLMLAVMMLNRSGSTSFSVADWPRFVSAMFGYHPSLVRFRGWANYLKIQYMWSWSVLWPIMVIAAAGVVSSLRDRIRMTASQIGFAVMLLAMPLLLLGDWGRSVLIAVPFAVIAAASHPLARDRYFIFLLALGGLSTALARPFHSTPPPPRVLTVAMTAISVAASLLIANRILRFSASKTKSQLDPAMDMHSHEAALP